MARGNKRTAPVPSSRRQIPLPIITPSAVVPPGPSTSSDESLHSIPSSPESNNNSFSDSVPSTSNNSSPVFQSTPTNSHENSNVNVPFDHEAFAGETREMLGKVLRMLNEREHNALNSKTNERLPLKLTEAVRNVYKDMEELASKGDPIQLWVFEKSVLADENAKVNAAISQGVRSTESSYSSSQIRKAIRSHFKTKKRKHNLKLKNADGAQLKQQRSRTRLNTRRLQRQKALQESTSISEETKKNVGVLLKTNAYVSSDESISDSSERENDIDSSDDEAFVKSSKKILSKKKLTWRNPELSNIMKRLDRKVEKKKSQKARTMTLERRDGKDSTRKPPSDAPAWALA